MDIIGLSHWRTLATEMLASPEATDLQLSALLALHTQSQVCKDDFRGRPDREPAPLSSSLSPCALDALACFAAGLDTATSSPLRVATMRSQSAGASLKDELANPKVRGKPINLQRARRRPLSTMLARRLTSVPVVVWGRTGGHLSLRFEGCADDASTAGGFDPCSCLSSCLSSAIVALRLCTCSSSITCQHRSSQRVGRSPHPALLYHPTPCNTNPARRFPHKLVLTRSGTTSPALGGAGGGRFFYTWRGV